MLFNAPIHSLQLVTKLLEMLTYNSMDPWRYSTSSGWREFLIDRFLFTLCQ